MFGTLTPAVPEFNTIPVAPVTLPIVIVLALALVPIFTAPVVPLSSVNAPVVVVNMSIPAVPVILPTLVKLPVTLALPLKFCPHNVLVVSSVVAVEALPVIGPAKAVAVTVPKTSSAVAGLFLLIPTLPAGVIRIRSRAVLRVLPVVLAAAVLNTIGPPAPVPVPRPL